MKLHVLLSPQNVDELYFTGKTTVIIDVLRATSVIAAALALGPPLLISYAFPDVFLTALEEAGLLGGVSLYGLLPALCLLSLRSNDSSSQIESMTGRLGGGNSTLFAILAISAALILPEIAHLLD